MSFDYTSGNPAHLTGGQLASMADIQGEFTDLKTFLNARIAAIPTLVSSLPVAPVDGQEIYYLADAANGVIWHLRYRAASASTYKWELAGGAPLRFSNTSTSTVTLATFQAMPGTLTAPLAGDYVMRVEAVGFIAAAAGALVLVPAINAVMPSAGGSEEQNGGAFITSTSAQGDSRSRSSVRTVTAAGQAVVVAGRVVTASNNGTSYFRDLEIIPIRVG